MFVLGKIEMDILGDRLSCKINNLTRDKEQDKKPNANPYSREPKDKYDYDLIISSLYKIKYMLERICEACIHIEKHGLSYELISVYYCLSLW